MIPSPSNAAAPPVIPPLQSINHEDEEEFNLIVFQDVMHETKGHTCCKGKLITSVVPYQQERRKEFVSLNGAVVKHAELNQMRLEIDSNHKYLH
jgi:hypothetical protein